jgi:hypothetical protein
MKMADWVICSSLLDRTEERAEKVFVTNNNNLFAQR